MPRAYRQQGGCPQGPHLSRGLCLSKLGTGEVRRSRHQSRKAAVERAQPTAEWEKLP